MSKALDPEAFKRNAIKVVERLLWSKVNSRTMNATNESIAFEARVLLGLDKYWHISDEDPEWNKKKGV